VVFLVALGVPAEDLSLREECGLLQSCPTAVQVHCAAGWVAVLLLVPCFCLFLLCLLPWMQPVEPVVK